MFIKKRKVSQEKQKAKGVNNSRFKTVTVQVFKTESKKLNNGCYIADCSLFSNIEKNIKESPKTEKCRIIAN